jgi:hypothetical protein
VRKQKPEEEEKQEEAASMTRGGTGKAGLRTTEGS